MTITLARMEDMSLQHYIKDIVLPLKWSERVENAPLQYNTTKQRFDAQIVWLPNFLDEGRGWVYFDPTGSGSYLPNSLPGQEQETRVVVYNEVGSIIDRSNYTVNYMEGAIIANGGSTTPQGVPTTVDFAQNYVSVIDGWPGTDPPALPIVAVDIQGFGKKGFQLGGGRKAVRRATVYVFATSSAERDDLNEWIHDALFQRCVVIQDWREGEPLNYDGTFNSSYNGTLLSLSNVDELVISFNNIRVDNISIRQDWSEANRWRSKISFEMVSYRDGIDLNAL